MDKYPPVDWDSDCYSRKVTATSIDIAPPETRPILMNIADHREAFKKTLMNFSKSLMAKHTLSTTNHKKEKTM